MNISPVGWRWKSRCKALLSQGELRESERLKLTKLDGEKQLAKTGGQKAFCGAERPEGEVG